jgi:predicted metalloprotease
MRMRIPTGRLAPSRRRVPLLAAATCMTLLAGCAQSVTGSPLRGETPPAATSQSAAATATDWPALPDLPSTSTPSPGTTQPEADQTEGGVIPGAPEVTDDQVGLLPDAPTPDLAITGDTDGEIDRLAVAALADLVDFYQQVLPEDFGMDYQPPGNLVSYDATDPAGTVCGESTLDYVNAFYAGYCDTVAWDRGVLLPYLAAEIGTLAPAIVMSHEIGHHVQDLLGESDATPTIVLEQQADCYAGAYWRWVADGHSEYYAFNQTEGMRQLLLALLSLKDQPMTREQVEAEGTDDNHGSGFDRTYAATLGYTEGAVRCSEIDVAEVDARGQEFPFEDDPYQYGNLDITTTTIAGILATVDDYFTEAQPGYVPPYLQMYASRTPPPCDGRQTTFPVAYCPGSNTVTYQLAEVKRIGTPAEGWESANGDFSAFLLLVSRYALAAQYAGRAAISGTDAGLQALCYAGTWARWMRTPHSDYQLSPNDLDKAIYQIIQSPLAGSDVDGHTEASIVDRVQAFGYGVTTTITDCFDTYVS